MAVQDVQESLPSATLLTTPSWINKQTFQRPLACANALEKPGFISSSGTKEPFLTSPGGHWEDMDGWEAKELFQWQSLQEVKTGLVSIRVIVFMVQSLAGIFYLFAFVLLLDTENAKGSSVPNRKKNESPGLPLGHQLPSAWSKSKIFPKIEVWEFPSDSHFRQSWYLILRAQSEPG